MTKTRETYENGVLVNTEVIGDSLQEWEAKIKATDSKLPRWGEDIIDALDAPTKAKINKLTIDLYEEKKQIRSEKPKEK